ncbi:MAG: DinB family protein [Ignavibacteria bacterium]
MGNWTMRNGEKVYFTMPKIAVLRGFVMSHLIHHRGQLSVYMRMLDIPLPSVYGPTADEPDM